MEQQKVETNNLKNKAKWLFILFNSVCLFTSTYIQQDLSTQHSYYKIYFEKSTDGNFETYFNMIYSISFFIMIFFNLYTGYVCDKYGGGISLLLGCLFSLFGQFLALISIRFEMIWILFVGRFFILSSISINIMSNARIISKHFSTEDLGFTNGTILTFQDLGIFFNLILASSLTQKKGLLYSNTFLFAMAGLGMFAGFLSYFLDQNLSKNLIENNKIQNQDQQVQKKQSKNQNSFFQGFNQNQSCLYFIVGIVALNISSTIFTILLPAYLTERFNLTPQKAGDYASFLPLGVICLPLISKLIDLTQKPLLCLIPCGFIGAWALLQMQLGFYPIICILLYGFQYNIRWGALFPSIEILAKKGTESKCFALIRGLRDLGSVFVTFINAVIHDKFGNYNNSILLLAALQILATITIFISNQTYNKQVQNTKIQYIENQEKHKNIENQDYQEFQNENTESIE